MVLLMLTLALALLSFLASAFVIIRIVVPVLPPNPLSRKVPPSEFGLPNFRSLNPAAKSYLWLACLDIFALAFFLWQALAGDLLDSPTITYDPLSTSRLWLALTTRQTCLFFIIALTLLYVRRGHSVSFGPKYCFIWVPTLVFVGTGLAFGAILSSVGVNTLWGGLAAYSAVIGIATTAAFGCLVGTLLLIRHNVNMAAQAELDEKEWPPLKVIKHRRRSITTEDIEALQEGSSWITSHHSSSSRQLSISAFSFSTVRHSTHGTSGPISGSNPSVLPKSSYWFGTGTPNSAAVISNDSIPPVPRVPSPYRDRPRTPPHASYDDLSDPFHRSPPRPPKSSANSWLTSPSVSQVTISEFSFPTTRSRPASPNEQEEQLNHPPATPTVVYEQEALHPTVVTGQTLSESRVLGGYGPQDRSTGLSPKASKDVNISIFRCVAWAISIWLPLGLSLPYIFLSSPNSSLNSNVTSILLTLSVTISSPLLALNILLGYSLPIPAALFSRTKYTPAAKAERLSTFSEVRIHPEMRTRNSSVTVVEGRRSGDIWIERGDAVDGRGKAARVLGLLAPAPRLAVLPFEKKEDGVLTPPLPIQDESAPSLAPSSPGSIEFGMSRTRPNSKSSSYYSGAEESMAYKTQIMVAQRHYSAMATTVYLNGSKSQGSGSSGGFQNTDAVASGVERGMTKTHMRTQSASSASQTPRSSINYRFPLTPPPSTPLPPTPPNVRGLHSRSQSSSGASGFSFRPIGNANQIDTLSAGVLPLLVPGLKVGSDVVVKDSPLPQRRLPPNRGVKSRKVTPPAHEEFGYATSGSFTSPENHSTPARPKGSRGSRQWKHMSLPSLGLGKDGVHSLAAWKEELVKVLGNFETKTPSSTTRHRRTVYGGETGVPPVPSLNTRKLSSDTRDTQHLNEASDASHIEFGYAMTSDDQRNLVRGSNFTPPTSASVYSDGFNTARSSLATMVEQPPTSATTLLPRSFRREQERFYNAPSELYTQKSQASPYHLPRDPSRRSSIVYIKSGENIPSTLQNTQSNSKNALRSSVKRLIPQKSFNAENSPLRKFTLLGTRDLNRSTNDTESGTPPLSISKKIKKEPSEKERGLRPLKLARSATAKARGLLRQDGVLPDIVVRSPSTSSHHHGHAYSYR